MSRLLAIRNIRLHIILILSYRISHLEISNWISELCLRYLWHLLVKTGLRFPPPPTILRYHFPMVVYSRYTLSHAPDGGGERQI